jgi:hypothetical protein
VPEPASGRGVACVGAASRLPTPPPPPPSSCTHPPLFHSPFSACFGATVSSALGSPPPPPPPAPPHTHTRPRTHSFTYRWPYRPLPPPHPSSPVGLS